MYNQGPVKRRQKEIREKKEQGGLEEETERKNDIQKGDKRDDGEDDNQKKTFEGRRKGGREMTGKNVKRNKVQ